MDLIQFFPNNLESAQESEFSDTEAEARHRPGGLDEELARARAERPAEAVIYRPPREPGTPFVAVSAVFNRHIEGRAQSADSFSAFSGRFEAFAVNGPSEFGLAVNVDPKLTTDKRLAIPPPGKTDDPKQWLAMAFAYCDFSETGECRRYFDDGLYLVVLHNWGNFAVDETGTQYMETDSDYVVRANARDGPFERNIMPRINASSARLADITYAGQIAGLVLSTKINFWQTNHHTGQGVPVGYVAKVMRSILGEGSVNNAHYAEALHRLGHYVSTLAFFKSVKPTTTWRQINGWSVVANFPALAADTKLRMDAFPAGTARVGLVHNAFIRIAKTPYAGFLGGVQGLSAIKELVADIRSDPARFHVGASYLVGVPTRPMTAVDDFHVALASAFVNIAMRGTTLSKAMVLMRESEYTSILGPIVPKLQLAVKLVARGGAMTNEELQVLAGAMPAPGENPFSAFVSEGEAFNVAEAVELGKRRMEANPIIRSNLERGMGRRRAIEFESEEDRLEKRRRVEEAQESEAAE